MRRYYKMKIILLLSLLAFGLLTYEKIYFDDKVEKQYGLFGVFPNIFQILNN